MSGDTSNVNIWSDADVYVAAIGAALPADAATPFPNPAWTLVGLLGTDGFDEKRGEKVAKHYAYGGVMAGISRSEFELTVDFTVLEDNVVTRALIWPGSTSTSTIVPVPADILLAFETRSGGKVRRKIVSNRAQVDVNGSIKTTETDLASVGLTATIFPNPTTKEIFIEQGKPTISSIAITALTLALSLAGKSIGKLVATATYSDTTTGDVSASALWTSATPTHATVSEGYVTAVATGTSNVSCTFGGVTSAAPSVVTVGT
jgi:hypothetical protein